MIGKKNTYIDQEALRKQIDGYDQVWVDIGTGDGQYVLHIARRNPQIFVIGIDACRENLRSTSRSSPQNVMFIIANALALPDELSGIAARLTINFPWGSLLAGLLEPNPDLLRGIHAVCSAEAVVEIRLNDSALQEAGWTLENGSQQVCEVLQSNGFRVKVPEMVTAQALRRYPTTWAKRLAYGRKSRATYLIAD